MPAQPPGGKAARILTEFTAVVTDPGKGVIDDRALAFELSEKTVRVETQAEVAVGQKLAIRLDLRSEGELRLKGRILWVDRRQLGTYFGLEFANLSRAERMQIRSVIGIAKYDWSSLADRGIRALVFPLGIFIGWSCLNSDFWRHFFFQLAPKAVAAILLAWSVRLMLTPSKKD